MKNLLALLFLTLILFGCGPVDPDNAPTERVTVTFDVPQGTFNRPIDLKLTPNILYKGRGNPINVRSTEGPLFYDDKAEFPLAFFIAYQIDDSAVEQIMNTLSTDLMFKYKSKAYAKSVVKQDDGSVTVTWDWNQDNGFSLYFLRYLPAVGSKPSGNFFALTN